MVAGKAIQLGRHDEIVLVQSFDFLGSQRNGRVPPAKRDIGVMALGLGQFSGAFDKPEGFAEILEAVAPLDPARLI